MTLVKFRPTSTPFHTLMDSLIHDRFPIGFATQTTPAVNVKEDDNAFYLDLVVPGFSKEQLSLHVEQRVLTLTGKTESTTQPAENLKINRKEFEVSAFERKFTLPESINVDGIAAGYTNGILQVYLPKLETLRNKPTRTIEIG